MDYYGLFPKFKFNRYLNDEELKYQLKQHKATELDGQSVVPDMKVITLSSHYLELVDKYYSAKGFLSLIVAFVFFQRHCYIWLCLLTPFPISD